MIRKSLILLALVTLAACGPQQAPPPDQNAQQPAAANAPPAPSPADQEAQKVQEEEHKLAELKREERRQRAAEAPRQVACADCGVVASITPVRKEGQAGYIGTLGGAAAGGLAGSQFGKGKGNTAMTVLGVVGGALAGREVEKQVTASTVYQVAVNMESGGQQMVTIDSVNGLAVGSHVHVQGGNLTPY